MNVKNEVLYRIYFLLFGIFIPIAILLLYKTIQIGVVEGETWKAKGNAVYRAERSVEAERGNILADDGSLLATSVPYFDIHFDPNAPGVTEELFNELIDTLAHCVATYIDKTYTPGGYKAYLQNERKAGARYVEIIRNANFEQKRLIESFPLFNRGQIKGGLIVSKRSSRKRPFGILANRTIGYHQLHEKSVGLEAFFDKQLGGEPGQQVMICIDKSRDIWIPAYDLSALEPKTGNDIVTTLNVTQQDIVEGALYRGVTHHDAEWGTAILMEVETGKIKAIANLGKTDEGWWEDYNYAVGKSIEPGSTFKLASMMALLEDKYVKLTDTVTLGYGETRFYDVTLVDASPESRLIDSTTVRRAFEMSSNVGIAKLINKHYGSATEEAPQGNAARFIQRLKDFNLHLTTGVFLEGEPTPYIKEAYSDQDSWSGITLPWMAMGYELSLTPLQVLNLYNAVANDGRMVRPMLVTQEKQGNRVVKEHKPLVMKQSIASRQTIEQIQSLLEGVVERGTASKLKTDKYRFAAKTGTSQVNYSRSARGNTSIEGYQASFAGYFPADNPIYSCIVVIYKPRQNGYYGADVAGPVFREIADKLMAMEPGMQRLVNNEPILPHRPEYLPNQVVGYRSDLVAAMDILGLPHVNHDTSSSAMAVIMPQQENNLRVFRRKLPTREIPDVSGMGLRDAIYALENSGAQVTEVRGVGKVVSQSVIPGTRSRGQSIRLTLN